MLADDIVLRLTTTGEFAAISLEERVPGRVGEFGLVHVLRNIHGLACWYVDSRIALRSASFPFEVPRHADVYPLLFPAPIQFNTKRAEISFDARYLDLPLRRDEAALQLMLKRALPLTVLLYRRDRLLVQQVRQTLANTETPTHNADTMAAALNLSPRSLHRQL
ncbi:MAG: AraC family transcriptional regulator, partial [Burkholderiales bacterium PBB4]